MIIPVITGVTEFAPTIALAVLSALGLLGGIGMGIKALIERKTLDATAKAAQAKAGNDDATAASIVAAAARELIDPLRQELATERAESLAEVQRERTRRDADVARERDKVQRLQAELDKAATDVSALRTTVRRLMEEVDDTQVKVLRMDQLILDKDRQIVLMEREIARYREARLLNEDNGLDSGPHNA